MDIPIRFKFFDKLKLYQDYLKQDSMLQRTKSAYWLAAKLIMFWGYSNDHQHLGVPLNVRLLDTKSPEILESLEKIGGRNNNATSWVKGNFKNKNELIRFVGNMLVLELVTKYANLSGNSGYTPINNLDPGEVVISLKGFLLGELLFETYEKPGFWSKNFRKYKFALLVFYLTFIITILTVYSLFIGQFKDWTGAEDFLTIGSYIVSAITQFWWSLTITCLILLLGLRHLWNRL